MLAERSVGSDRAPENHAGLCHGRGDDVRIVALLPSALVDSYSRTGALHALLESHGKCAAAIRPGDTPLPSVTGFALEPIEVDYVVAGPERCLTHGRSINGADALLMAVWQRVEGDLTFMVAQSATAARLCRRPFGDSTARSALAVLASAQARAQQQTRRSDFWLAGVQR